MKVMDFSLTPITPTVISSILMAVQEMTYVYTLFRIQTCLREKIIKHTPNSG